MKAKEKARISIDIVSAALLITAATVTLVLAPEIGIAISPPMIETALLLLNDARRIGLQNPFRFFKKKKKEEKSKYTFRP